MGCPHASDHPDLWRLNGLAVSCRVSRKRGGVLVRKIEEFLACILDEFRAELTAFPSWADPLIHTSVA